ncbi:MAG: ABC transporter permease subunit [Oscillospiraceae bacterium]
MLDLIISTLTQGFIYAMLSYGIYITYKILDFPDLTVDGSFPLGAAVTALLLVKGVNPYLTLLAALLVGAAAGFVTGFIHVRLKVRDLLAGIITMTALFQ